MEEDNKGGKKKDWARTIEVAGSELINRIKELIQEGNIRKLILKKDTGEVLLEIPLTAGVAAGSAAVLLAPVLAALGALAALVAKIKIEIVRIDDKPQD